MQFSLFKKFKMTLVILVSWFSFNACLGLVQPSGHEGVVSVVFHPQPLRVLGVSVVLAFAGAVFGILMDRRHYREFGLIAIASGFTAWAMKTGLMDQLLLRHPVSAERATLFYRLIADGIIWLAIGAAGYLGAVSLARFVKWTTPTVDSEASTPSRKQENSSSLLRKGLAVGFVFLISLFLLKLLVRSNPAASVGLDSIAASRGADIGQIVFALFTAFYLAAWSAGSFFSVSVRILLAGPPIVATVSYLLASRYIVSQSLLEQSLLFLNPAVIFAVILPIQFVAIGSLGVIVGYSSVWRSEPEPR